MSNNHAVCIQTRNTYFNKYICFKLLNLPQSVVKSEFILSNEALRHREQVHRKDVSELQSANQLILNGARKSLQGGKTEEISKFPVTLEIGG